MSRTFDLIVIGAGSAAGSYAWRCRSAGWTVAMIDKQLFGGTCALRSCDPKKVLGSKVLVEDGTQRILGAHLPGPEAGETINLFALAMRANVTADRFRQMMWADPTKGSDTSYMV